ncbi:MAG: CO dehydrogenase/CO-methylating acetyl-CoA synthase complex subunit beta [Methanocellales archaeon]|nr:CO dehydrogenase/CO-methylating acetyl-CoA synthase complex subunit beta [Methanocellales archaeon]
MFADLPVEVGLAYEGERIRKPQMHVELGGPNVKEKFELLRVKSPEEVEDGKITIIGPDVQDLEEGSSVPFGIYIEVSGDKLEVEMEGVMERRIHDFCNYIEGFMHLNQRDSIWLRLDKKAVKKGLNFDVTGKALQRLFKSEMSIIEKMQITFLTEPVEVKKKFQEALDIYEARDARARGMTDNDVDVFYGCTLCQSFAPSHICVISAQRYANCGAISWFDGRAAAKVDPKGPVFEIPKEKCLDEWKGEYEGINKIVSEKSLGEIDRIQLYTAFDYPHTSCGCFEITTFYVPECDGLGVVHRDFKGQTPSGLTFGGLADSTGGGRQVNGFHGISFEYMRSPKFLQVDGGWNRIVWLPTEVKEKMKDYIPKELYDKIATEDDATDIVSLKEFLKEKGHPVVEKWVEKPPDAIEAQTLEAMPVGTISGVGIPSGGITIILKNAKIHAEKVIIKRAK